MILYQLGVELYGLSIRIASFRNVKARQWVAGRKHWRDHLSKKLAPFKGESFIWFHCASYGEFEQGRPLIEALAEKYTGHRILISFFSPSGYEAFKNWEGADVVTYLPLDSRKNARDFIRLVAPSKVVFVKYEFWLHYLNELKLRKIPTYLVSAVFKKHHPFFKWYGHIFRKSLEVFKLLLVQDEQSKQLLERIHIHNVKVCGDTRFDRVVQIREQFSEIPEIKMFKGRHKLFACGSTWPKDEAWLLKVLSKPGFKDVKIVFAPHEIDANNVRNLVNKVKSSGLSCCVFTEGVDPSASVLILDTMGMLSRVYAYADAAYIGGGFNDGLHNTLEAAVYGIPVLFYGETYFQFNEAVELKNIGAADNPSDATSLESKLKIFLFDEALRNEVKSSLETFFAMGTNSTKRIADEILVSTQE